MKRVQFVVPGPPPTWERTGTSQKNTTKHEKAKKAIAMHSMVAMRRARLRPFEGPVGLSLLAVYPRNLQRPPWVDKASWDTGRRLYKPTTPDADNMAKIFADGMQPTKNRRGNKGAPFCLGDDKQVCALHAVQVIAAEGERPKTIVTVEALPAVYTDTTEADAGKAPAS